VADNGGVAAAGEEGVGVGQQQHLEEVSGFAMRDRLRLSTCWNGHRYQDGLSLAGEARDMGFAGIEISHGTPVTLIPGFLQAVQRKVVTVGSLHAPCPSPVEVQGDMPDRYEFTSVREEERRRAVSLTVATMEMAARFGVDRMVLHLGRAMAPGGTEKLEAMALNGGLFGRPYVKCKLALVAAREKASGGALEQVKRALDELLPHAEKHGVKIGMETRSHYEQVPTMQEMEKLLAHYAGCPWIGTWHDFGHVQRQANLGFLDHRAFLELNVPRLLGCHVHDVGWPHKDHQIPFSSGEVDFAGLLPLVGAEVPLVWEMSPRQKRLEIVAAREEWERRFGGGL
jgi:sugar phosphate isomerase/epimerase